MEHEKEINEAYQKLLDGESEFIDSEDAEMKMDVVKRKIKRALPVRLTEEQHSYLDGKTIGKAEYIRNLLVIDMEKNK